MLARAIALAAPYAASPKVRMAVSTVAATVFYGSWAAWWNWSEGVDVALRAAGAQAFSSATSTFALSALVELLVARLIDRRGGPALAALIAAITTAAIPLGAQLAVGTPDALITALPSIVAGFVFAGIYALTMVKTRHLAAS